jgi:PAS domain S-box-containing protein
MSKSDQFYKSAEFQGFFKGATRSLVLKADSPTFTVLAASDLYLFLTHKNREEVLNNGLFETYPGAHSDPNEKDSVFSSFVRVINTGEKDELPIFKYEISIANTNKKETHYWTNVNEPILDENGQVAYIINTTTNITERIRQQNAVNESESRFRLMAEGTDVMIAVSDELGRAIYFNNAWEAATGKSSSELLEFGWVDLVHPDDKPNVMAIFQSSIEKQDPWMWEFRLSTRTGTHRWFMTRATPRFTADGNFAGYISSAVDITQQKDHQATLTKLNEDLYNINKELSNINEELKKAQDELLGSNAKLAKSQEELLLSKAKLEENDHLLKLALQSSGIGIWITNLDNGELTLSDRGKDIQGMPDDVTLTFNDLLSIIDPLDSESVSEAMNSAIEHKGHFITEYKINTYSTKILKWLRTSGIVQKDNSGKPIRILGTIQDVTEQRLNDQRKSDFISMVSHELKTPLTSINGYVQILEDKAQKDDNMLSRSLLGKAGKQVGKMTNLINGFLNVSRLESAKIHMERTKFDISTMIAEVKDESLASITSHKVIFAPVEERVVVADRDKIGQVLNNLINNAVKYSPAGTNINVSCITRGDYVIVSVKDEGYGISEENLPKTFERYYRVESGLTGVSGFGIGLYLCYEIIKRHNGNIWAHSSIGKGSTFYFTLPL